MKIVFFLYGLVGGGAERVITLIANEMSSRGLEVYIATNDIQPVYALSDDIRLIKYNVSTVYGIRYRIELIKSMKSILKEIQPDVAVGVMDFYAFYLRIASIGLHTRVIVSDHSTFKFQRGLKTYFIKHLFYPFMDKTFVLTNSDYKSSWFKRNVVVMPNPLTFDICQHNNRSKVILGVGNVETWNIKGFDLLISAWARICDKYPEWTLKIVGRGDSLYLRNLALSLNVSSRVEICPFTRNIVEEYANASIFVLSSRTEGFPMCLVEAMSQGCACLAVENYGRTFDITGLDGALLCKTNNIEALTSGLRMLIENKDKRMELSEMACKQVARFSLDVIVNKWIKEIC